MIKQPKVYIIILNYNNYFDTLECIESVLKLNYTQKKIIVIDNDSPNQSGKYIEKWLEEKKYTQIIFIKSNKNLGYAGGNNIGIKQALQDRQMKYVWILNNDTIVDEYALEALIKKANESPNIGACGSKLIYDWDRTKIQGYGGTYNKWLAVVGTIKNEEQIKNMDYVIGASMLIKREVLENIGLLGEDYFLFFEELDYAQRMKGKYTWACATDSIVYHKEGASIGAKASEPKKTSYISDYYTIRNRILITKKYFPYCIFTVYLGLLLAIINRFRRDQKDRIFMIIRLMFGKT